jgi:alpha-glucosidase
MRKGFPIALLFVSVVWLLVSAGAAPPDNLAVSSPDGNLAVSLALKSNPRPYPAGERVYYRVSYKGVLILEDSPLGLDFEGSNPLDRDFDVIVPDKFNELTVSLRERRAPGRRLDLVFRAYDEGIALRYFLPEQESLGKFVLAAENTGFYFARPAWGYTLNLGRFNTSNEGEMPRTSLDEIKPVSIINLPLLVETPGGPWAALLEADLADYPGLYVGGVADVPGALVSRLSPVPPRLDRVLVSSTPKATPWRLLLVGPTAGSLIEANYLVLNLNPPCALADISWIKPGKAAWDWWSGSYADDVDFEPGMNTPTMKHYVDFAAAHHLEYMLIDAGWYPEAADSAQDDILSFKPEVNVPEIIAYARDKGVRVLLWVEWRPLDRKLDQALALYEKWGAAGVKVDYMNRDDQEMVNLYEKWVRRAAEHHLVVDFHGAFKGTGLRRTYPNLLTREGVMGMEYGKWSDRVTPEHDLTIPFTRMLAGPMDFTPGGFHNAVRGRFVARDVAPMTQGTRAHQLAMYVVYESPLVMVSDYPEAYAGQPGLEFIEAVPTVWDETRVLAGEPAHSIVVAREKDGVWYLGAMTDWQPRDLKISLGFLAPGDYEARLFSDGPRADSDGTSLSVENRRLTRSETIEIHLAPGGGLAAWLKPVK